MHILVTNDDGVTAPGLLALAQEMRSLGQVSILAPDRNWSASGHVKTMHRPLRVKEVALADGSLALASDGEQGLAKIKERHFDIILADLMMPILSGFDLLSQVREHHPDTVVIVITGYATVEHSIEAMKKGAWAEAVRALELSKLYPEKLGTGAPFRPDSRMQDYLIALCLDRMGEKDQAAALREAIRDYTLTYWDEPQPYAYFGGLVLEKLGRREDRLKAREILAGPKPSAEIMAVVSALR